MLHTLEPMTALCGMLFIAATCSVVLLALQSCCFAGRTPSMLQRLANAGVYVQRRCDGSAVPWGTQGRSPTRVPVGSPMSSISPRTWCFKAAAAVPERAVAAPVVQLRAALQYDERARAYHPHLRRWRCEKALLSAPRLLCACLPWPRGSALPRCLQRRDATWRAQVRPGTQCRAGAHLRCADGASVLRWLGPPAAVVGDRPAARGVRRGWHQPVRLAGRWRRRQLNAAAVLGDWFARAFVCGDVRAARRA